MNKTDVDFEDFSGLFDSILNMPGGGNSRKYTGEYTPTGKSREILDRAMEHVQSVDYQVSVRWVFYRLLQEGLYSKKSDYILFIQLTSRARHKNYGQWNPITLADETRSMIKEAYEGDKPGTDPADIFDSAEREDRGHLDYLKERAANYYSTYEHTIDPNYYQDSFCIIMFEARAMVQQFKKYTEGLTLCPFGGQPSIPYKYRIATYLHEMSDKYDKPVTVLYFGDLDKGGDDIFNAGSRDIKKWCSAPIKFIRCGLTEQQVERYNIPENFDHPGYQWEALDDRAAQEIIADGLKPYYDTRAADRAYREAAGIQEAVRAEVDKRLSEE